MGNTYLPRVGVTLKASKTCYLSCDPPFFLVVRLKLHNIDKTTTFLKDGDSGLEDCYPINSNEIFQCFDEETGERVAFLQSGTSTELYNFERGCLEFATWDKRESYELPLYPSALQAGRRYKLQFLPTTSICHWPAGISTSSTPSSKVQEVVWTAKHGNDTVTFEARTGRPKLPKVTASLLVPMTWSLAEPFNFTITFTSDSSHPITVLKQLDKVHSETADIDILDAKSRTSIGLDMIHYCGDERPYVRDDFDCINGTLTEHRTLKYDPLNWMWESAELKVGEEYIFCHKGGFWWWTEDSIDETMEYLNSPSNLGFCIMAKSIEYEGADEVRFKVVE